MKTEHKFKVGDKVKFISKKSSNAKYFKRGLDNLEIRSLIIASNYDYRVYESDKSHSWGVEESEIELQEDTTNLTGRYVKALVDNANCITCKVGDLFLVTDDNNINTCITRLSDGQSNWSLSKAYLGTEWELMPKDFNPNKSEEPFAIQLHSQEELDAIMSFYKEKGYKMQGSSDYYLDDFVVYIKPEYKTWQTAINDDEDYPFKTLSELGITVNTTPQFEVNKWYKANLEEGVFYLKLLKQEKNKIWASEQISVKTSGFAKEPTLCFDNSVNYKTDRYELLTDLSEIQKYLPLGHPDLIVNNNSMYKVGDFVLANGSRGAGGWSSQIVQLLDLSVGSNCGGLLNKNSDFVAKLSNGYTYTIANSNIERKAKLEEIKTDLLSEDELLQVAKQFYPVGTKFRTIYGENKIGTVKFNDANYFEKHRNPLNITITVEEYYKNCPKWSIYSKEKGWAKIINSPIQESDNFVLPEKWYCKRTKENSKILNEWNNRKYNTGAFCEKGEGCMFSDKNYSTFNLTNYGDYQEITFDQFKKYVLNKSEVIKENGSGLTIRPEKSINDLGVIFHEDGYIIKPHPTFIKETTSKKLTSPKIIPIKVRNCNITETKSTRTRVKIIKKSII